MTPDDLSPLAAAADPGTAPQGPRQTLAMRLAERNRQRELRAERLARLRAPADPAAPGEGPEPAAGLTAEPAAAPVAASPESVPDPAPDPAGELEDFLRSLAADLPPLPEGPPVEPGELVPFQRPEPAEAAGGGGSAGDLFRLPGIGPGLVWALERAGLGRLADIAPLAPAELAARLGPLGRLVPADRWIAAAREAGA